MNKLLLSIPPVALLCLGLVFGLIWGKATIHEQHELKKESEKETTREFNMLYALIYAARIDGMTPHKHDAIMSIFKNLGYNEITLSQIDNDLTLLSNEPIDIHKIIQNYKSVPGKHRRLFLWECIDFVAESEGTISENGRKILEGIRNELDLTSPEDA